MGDIDTIKEAWMYASGEMVEIEEVQEGGLRMSWADVSLSATNETETQLGPNFAGTQKDT